MTLTLGPEWQRELWVSPYRIRFELDGGGDLAQRYVTRFTTSYDRARQLARAALPTENLAGIIAAFPDPSMEMNAKWHGWEAGTGFDHLKVLGVSTDDALATWDGYWWPDSEDDPEQEPWVHRAVNLTWEEADILLWNQVAQDMGVSPRAPVLSKLVDLARGVSVDAYDDRGMDVTSLTKEPTAGLYDQFNTWLLDYDRSRMAEAFEL